MNIVQIKIGKNGVQANKELNVLAKQLEGGYKTSKNLKFYFELGFDGEWEFYVENAKTNKKIVLRRDLQKPGHQEVFIYFTDSENQLTEDMRFPVLNNNLLDITKMLISKMSK